MAVDDDPELQDDDAGLQDDDADVREDGGEDREEMGAPLGGGRPSKVCFSFD